MDPSALYDEDIHAWSQHQAALPRRLAAANPAARPNDLDLEHVAAEIEAAGNEQRFGVESNLIQAFIHLVRLVALPGDQGVRHWTKEANAFLATAARRWRLSMRRAVDPDDLRPDACRQVARNLDIGSHTVPPLPRKRLFGLEELVSGRADPRELAARVATAVATSQGTPGA